MDDEYVSAVFLALRDHVQLLPQLVSQSQYFFTQPSLASLSLSSLSAHSLTVDSASQLLLAVSTALNSTAFDAMAISAQLRKVAEESGVEGRTLFWLLRMALTMEEKGPSLSELLATMGQQRVIKRLDHARDAINALHEQQRLQHVRSAVSASQ